MTVLCPVCGVTLVAVLPPDRIVGCPNRKAGCGQWWKKGGYWHWFPQLLKVVR